MKVEEILLLKSMRRSMNIAQYNSKNYISLYLSLTITLSHKQYHTHFIDKKTDSQKNQ